jgi:hypothetical protein
VADDGGDRRVEGAYDTGVVGDVREHPVGRDVAGLGGASVAADVDGDGAVAGVGEGRQLVAPGVPGLGEAVDEQDDGALPLFDEVDAAAGDRYGPVDGLGHGVLLECWVRLASFGHGGGAHKLLCRSGKCRAGDSTAVFVVDPSPDGPPG